MSLRDISDITRLGVVKKIIEVIDYFMSNDIDASRIKGQLDISNIPPAGLDNVIKVDTVTDMLALTVDDVQNGDTVMIIGVTPPVQYQVVDDTKLGTMDAFQEYAAGTATKALADINGNNIHTTYGKLAGNNTWTGNNYWNGSAIFNANLTIRGSATTPGDVSTYLWLGTQPEGSEQTPSICRNKIGDLVMYAADYRPCYLRSGIQTSFASVYNSDGTVEFSSLNNTPWGKYTKANGLELTVHKTPTVNNDVPNKKYVDDSVASATADLLSSNNIWTGNNTYNRNIYITNGSSAGSSGTLYLGVKPANETVQARIGTDNLGGLFYHASTNQPHVFRVGTNNNVFVIRDDDTKVAFSSNNNPFATVTHDGVAKWLGNAKTATKLQTARTINGVSFDGTANITIADSTKLPIAGGTMTGDLTLKGNPTADLMAATKKYVDDSVASAGGGDVLAAGNNSFTGANTFQNLVTMVGGVVFTSGTTTLAWKNATQIVATINASTYTGNSATATKLQTARTINGVSFDGTANITIADSTKLPIAGGTMTGDLTLKGNPTADLMAATKKYVDDSVASAGGGDVLAAGNNSFTGANTFQNLVTMVGGVVFTSGTTTLAWKNATQIVATINASTYTGNSATATKLATARTITANLASSTAGSFDGSANITVGVTGTLPIANGGTGATTAAAARTALGCAPAYTYSTTDLTAGSSALTTGTLYIVYE